MCWPTPVSLCAGVHTALDGATGGKETVPWDGSLRGVLRGEGEIAGCFFCSAPPGCASLAGFRDGQYALIGRYRIPEEAVAEPER